MGVSGLRTHTQPGITGHRRLRCGLPQLAGPRAPPCSDPCGAAAQLAAGFVLQTTTACAMQEDQCAWARGCMQARTLGLASSPGHACKHMLHQLAIMHACSFRPAGRQAPMAGFRQGA